MKKIWLFPVNLKKSATFDADEEEEIPTDQVSLKIDGLFRQQEIELAPLDFNWPPVRSKNLTRVIRRVIVIEVLDCDECLNDANLSNFIDSLKNPISNI